MQVIFLELFGATLQTSSMAKMHIHSPKVPETTGRAFQCSAINSYPCAQQGFKLAEVKLFWGTIASRRGSQYSPFVGLALCTSRALRVHAAPFILG